MIAGVKTDFVLVRGFFFFGPSLAVSGHHCGIPAPQFPQTNCQSSKILLCGLFLSLIYLFFKRLYFFGPFHSFLGSERIQKHSSFSLSSHNNLPCSSLLSLPPTTTTTFHLCLSRSSGRVKLSKSVLIIRTGTCLPALLCVSLCVCVHLPVSA